MQETPLMENKQSWLPESTFGMRLLARMRRYVVRVAWGHIAFFAAWLILSAIHPPLGEAIANLLSPLGMAMEKLYPVVGTLWHGSMSANFYRSLTAEVFFASFLVALFTLLGILSRGVTAPWLFIETIAVKNKTAVFSAKITVFVIFSAGFAWLSAAFMLPLWFGMMQANPPDIAKPIHLHQLGLWALQTPMTCMILLLMAFLVISYFSYIARTIINLVRSK